MVSPSQTCRSSRRGPWRRWPATSSSIDAAFVGRDVAAVEAGGDLLVERGVGQQVAGELLDGELVERHVPVEGLDDPVAIGPHLAVVVEVDAVRVGVAGGVEPVAAAVLAPVLARRASGRQTSRTRSGTRVGDERLDVFGVGRQAGEVEASRGGPACGGRPERRA